jgi:hypothetical protein
MSRLPEGRSFWLLRLSKTVHFTVLAALAARSAFAADFGSVASVEHNGSAYVNDASGEAARQRTARAFYATHQDAYDFLIVFPAFAVDFGATEVSGLHWTVRNDVSGIGSPHRDLGAAYGSRSRLKGYIDLGALRPGSSSVTVSASIAVLAHEVAHQWAGSVRFRDRSTGQLSGELLGKDGKHWSFFLDSDAALLYGSDWEPSGNGTHRAVRSRERYSNLAGPPSGSLRAPHTRRLGRPTVETASNRERAASRGLRL